MKVSVSLPEEDVAFLDAYAKESGIESRSAVVHKAVRLLRSTGLGGSYEEAWEQWTASEDSVLWDPTAADGPGG